MPSLQITRPDLTRCAAKTSPVRCSGRVLDNFPAKSPKPRICSIKKDEDLKVEELFGGDKRHHKRTDPLSLSLSRVRSSSHAIFSAYPDLMENSQIPPLSMEFPSQNPNLRDLLEIPAPIRPQRGRLRGRRAGDGAPPRRNPKTR